MRRRDFLLTTGAALGCWAGRARPPVAPGLDRIGVQLYTARARARADLDGTLALIAGIGYREVEFAGYYGHGPFAVRDMLATHGLAAPAAHVDFADLGGGWDGVLNAAAVIGHRWVIVPWLPAERRQTAADYADLAARFERAGIAARAAGLRFAYHNHADEFADLGGGLTGYDILLRETSADHVDFELDCFWMRRGGKAPLDYFARWPGRFPLVHVKDMDAGGRMVDPGEGVIDFGAIVARGPEGGVRHWFVEHDDPPDIVETLRKGYRYLRDLTP